MKTVSTFDFRCRFRVVEEVWSDPNPDSDKTSISTSNDPLECGDGNPDSLIEPKAPYTIIVSLFLRYFCNCHFCYHDFLSVKVFIILATIKHLSYMVKNE